jgi:hypothetical protein
MKSRTDEASSAIFLIGLGLLFVTGWWWPGMLFVIAASSMARVMSEGQPWTAATGALWMAAIGLVFMFHLNFGIIWIVFGFAMLAAYMIRCNDGSKAKRKNDDFDDYV